MLDDDDMAYLRLLQFHGLRNPVAQAADVASSAGIYSDGYM